MDSPATKVIYRNSAPIFQSDGGGGDVALESYSIIAFGEEEKDDDDDDSDCPRK